MPRAAGRFVSSGLESGRGKGKMEDVIAIAARGIIGLLGMGNGRAPEDNWWQR
jgi:hypothetical protein